MAETAIEWTQRSWNPIVGCSIVSPGCTNCYAMKMADRLEHMAPQPDGDGNPHLLHYRGTTTRGQYLSKPPVWTGKLKMAPDRIGLEPLRRRKPTTWFVNSMGDLFHEDVPEEWIDRVFAVMALCPQHTFQVLTKRASWMRAYLTDPETPRRVYELACELTLALRLNVVLIAPGTDERFAPAGARIYLDRWPLPNVWLGVSAEDQRRADERIPDLLATPAAIHFVSAEPTLGPIDFRQWQHSYGCGCGWGGDSPLDYCTSCGWRGHAREALGVVMCQECREEITDSNACPECDGHDGDGMSFGPNHLPPINWIIVGGESGPGARPMHPDWARSIRDQCAAAGTAFFFKQWGEWQPREWCRDAGTHALNRHPEATFQKIQSHPDSIERVGAGPDWQAMAKVGKTRAGRLLDGVEHNAMPEVRHG